MREAVRLAPALWANLARALHTQALAEEALRRAPNNLLPLTEAARSAVGFGLLDRGRDLTERALALAGKHFDETEGDLNRALTGEWHDAAEGIDRCVGLIGLMRLERGQPAEARAEYEAALRYTPGFPRAIGRDRLAR